jgi:hypothetical protein
MNNNKTANAVKKLQNSGGWRKAPTDGNDVRGKTRSRTPYLVGIPNRESNFPMSPLQPRRALISFDLHNKHGLENRLKFVQCFLEAKEVDPKLTMPSFLQRRPNYRNLEAAQARRFLNMYPDGSKKEHASCRLKQADITAIAAIVMDMRRAPHKDKVDNQTIRDEITKYEFEKFCAENLANNLPRRHKTIGKSLMQKTLRQIKTVFSANKFGFVPRGRPVTQVRIDRETSLVTWLCYMACRRVATRVPVGDLLYGKINYIPPQLDYNMDCCGVLFDEDLKTIKFGTYDFLDQKDHRYTNQRLDMPFRVRIMLAINRVGDFRAVLVLKVKENMISKGKVGVENGLQEIKLDSWNKFRVYFTTGSYNISLFKKHVSMFVYCVMYEYE